MKTLRIIALQYDMAWEDKGQNKQTVERMLASAPRADLILLPEMFNTGFTMKPEKVAESTEGETLAWAKGMAAKYNALIFGSWPVKSEGKFFNRMYGVWPSGAYKVYDKRHLFSYGGEDKVYHPGKDRQMMEYQGWQICPFVCYDLRFPIWMRNTEPGDLYLIPANWPDTRISHWSTLLRARAIENQVYVAGVNRIGTQPGGLHYNGGSAIIDYSGETLCESFDKEEVLYAELSKEKLDSFRQNFPFLNDRDAFEWK